MWKGRKTRAVQEKFTAGCRWTRRRGEEKAGAGSGLGDDNMRV
jgi:hypothetical protein